MCEGEERIGEADEERMELCCLQERGGAERACGGGRSHREGAGAGKGHASRGMEEGGKKGLAPAVAAGAASQRR